MYYVMSDIHGCYDQMNEALKEWNPNNEHLVVIGDLIDRGPDSLKVVRKLMDLTHEYPNQVTVLKGNHEEMLLAWLLGTPTDLFFEYYNSMHNETIKSFLGKKRFKKSSRNQRGLDLLYKHKPELNFMNDLSLFLETDKMLYMQESI